MLAAAFLLAPLLLACPAGAQPRTTTEPVVRRFLAPSSAPAEPSASTPAESSEDVGRPGAWPEVGELPAGIRQPPQAAGAPAMPALAVAATASPSAMAVEYVEPRQSGKLASNATEAATALAAEAAQPAAAAEEAGKEDSTPVEAEEEEAAAEAQSPGLDPAVTNSSVPDPAASAVLPPANQSDAQGGGAGGDVHKGQVPPPACVCTYNPLAYTHFFCPTGSHFRNLVECDIECITLCHAQKAEMYGCHGRRSIRSLIRTCSVINGCHVDGCQIPGGR